MAEHRLHRLDELRPDAVVDQMARRQRASLAAVGREAPDPGRRRLLDIGVGADDQRRLAAKLHEDALECRRRLRLEHRAHLVRYGDMAESDDRDGGEELARGGKSVGFGKEWVKTGR